MSTVGFIGLGNMGGHMARNLAKAGHKLVVFDANAKVVEQFKAEGASAASSPAEVAAAAQQIITMLPSSPHVREVYTGKKGLIETLQRDSLCLDSSTIDQSASIEPFIKLGNVVPMPMIVCVFSVSQRVAEKQAIYLDTPVSGGVLGAQNATLTFMVGGANGNEVLLQRAEQLLTKMGKNVVDCGAVGNGQVAKICNNMLAAIQMIGVAETMNLGQRMGIDAKKLSSIINTSSGRCWSSDTYNPMPGVIESVPSCNDYEGGFRTTLMAKDLSLAQNAATLAGAPTPMGSLAHQLYRILAQNPKFSGKDFGVIFKFLQSQQK